MPYTLAACTVADAPALAVNNMTAFWGDPTWPLLWDVPLETIIAGCTDRMPWNLLRDRDSQRQVKAVDETGKLVGYARWGLPASLVGRRGPSGDEDVAWPEARVPDVTKEERMRFLEQHTKAWWKTKGGMDGMDDPVHERVEQLMGGKEYISLQYLAVHPDNAGKGIATLLVQQGVIEADKLGVDIFIIAYKAGRGVYKRLGFKELDRLIQDDTKYGGKGEYGTYFMLYEAKKGQPSA